MSEPLAVLLVRDKEGKPLLDHPLSAYPPAVREAIERQLTPEEKEKLNAA